MLIGSGLQFAVALNLKLEQRAGTQQPIHLAHIALYDLAAGDVLKDDGRECEVEWQVRYYR